MSTNDTPRTDAIALIGLCADSYIAQMTDLARELERENAKLREVIAELEKDKARVDLAERLIAEGREIVANGAGFSVYTYEDTWKGSFRECMDAAAKNSSLMAK